MAALGLKCQDNLSLRWASSYFFRDIQHPPRSGHGLPHISFSCNKNQRPPETFYFLEYIPKVSAVFEVSLLETCFLDKSSKKVLTGFLFSNFKFRRCGGAIASLMPSRKKIFNLFSRQSTTSAKLIKTVWFEIIYFSIL